MESGAQRVPRKGHLQSTRSWMGRQVHAEALHPHCKLAENVNLQDNRAMKSTTQCEHATLRSTVYPTCPGAAQLLQVCLVSCQCHHISRSPGCAGHVSGPGLRRALPSLPTEEAKLPVVRGRRDDAGEGAGRRSVFLVSKASALTSSLLLLLLRLPGAPGGSGCRATQVGGASPTPTRWGS